MRRGSGTRRGPRPPTRVELELGRRRVCELNEPDRVPGPPRRARRRSSRVSRDMCHDPEAGAVQTLHATPRHATTVLCLLTHSTDAAPASALNAGEA
jgi:hypothetical protein